MWKYTLLNYKYATQLFQSALQQRGNKNEMREDDKHKKRKLAKDTIITAIIIYHYKSMNTNYNGPDFIIDNTLPSLLWQQQ